MAQKPKNDLTKALAMAKRTAGGAHRDGSAAASDPGPGDLGELFLAELKIRRAHLRKWIDTLSREADRDRTAPVRRGAGRDRRGCRGGDTVSAP